MGSKENFMMNKIDSLKNDDVSSFFMKCECKQRILIVDDNEYNLMPLRYLIKEVKFNQKIMQKIMENSKYPDSSSNLLSFS